ncbi:hypothetical protein NECID01_1542 [Nematocida sp. AWRm77]|nr:hypothetical protein NECID01_1542 [Nematocida sp. AWRm77]
MLFKSSWCIICLYLLGRSWQSRDTMVLSTMKKGRANKIRNIFPRKDSHTLCNDPQPPEISLNRSTESIRGDFTKMVHYYTTRACYIIIPACLIVIFGYSIFSLAYNYQSNLLTDEAQNSTAEILSINITEVSTENITTTITTTTTTTEETINTKIVPNLNSIVNRTNHENITVARKSNRFKDRINSLATGRAVFKL